MFLYLIKILVLLIFSIFVGYNFYALPGHSEAFSGYFPYIISSIIIYLGYKYIVYHSYSGKKEIEISMPTIISLFLVNLFILSFYYFSLEETQIGYGFNMFFTIIFLSILPISIFAICSGFGKFLITKIIKRSELEETNHSILGLAIGFVAFITLLTIFGLFGLYNIWIVLLILIVFAILGYKWIIKLAKSILNTKYTFNNDTLGNAKLFVSEFFVFVSFIILGIALICIVRPYPIGWDDLGVYMNFPHLMAEAGSIKALGGMYSWNVYTGIGYMFNSPIQAFFLNIAGLFLSFIVLNITSGDLIKGEKKQLISLPIILSTIFIAMPMVFFQTAKDMKVDEGLLFISVIIIYFLYKYYLAIKDNKHVNILYILIIGILAGFAFSLKFTSLLLILGILAVLSYSRFSIAGLIGYILSVFGVFTLLDLWFYMQMDINPSGIANLELYGGIGLIITGLVFIVFAIIKRKENIKIFFREVLLFLIGVVVILLPWFYKNVLENYPNLSIGGIVSGHSSQYSFQYDKIYSEKEYKEITDGIIAERGENYYNTNEDMMRYFGYNSGILNYVNMFWNSTMQLNQTGEYTNIGFIYLALLPLIFIFLPYKKKYYFLFFVLIAVVQVLFYTTPNSKYLGTKDLESLSQEEIEMYLISNDDMFRRTNGKRDIFDIDVFSYYEDSAFREGLRTNNTVNKIANDLMTKDNNKNDLDYYIDVAIEDNYTSLEDSYHLAFYTEVKEKVEGTNSGAYINIIAKDLTSEDMELIVYLNRVYEANKMFKASNISVLKEELANNNVSEEAEKKLINAWNNSRSLAGKIVDKLITIPLPIGYVYLFLAFIIPTIYLILTLKKTPLNTLFKLNLVFTSLYVFLWLISSFGIVWYGITMYFSFLLMIGIGAYEISSLKDYHDEKKLNLKLAGTAVFLLIIIYYIFASLMPYIFNNLKNTGYADYKAGRFDNYENAVFNYQANLPEMIFATNIDSNKSNEFFAATITPGIRSLLNSSSITSFSEIFRILKELTAEEGYENESRESLNNIYKELINPRSEFRNKDLVLRVGTFLRYYITENDVRIFDDTMLYTFSDYIYSPNIDTTIDRLRDLGIKYMLVDLNSATIDNSLNHDLTNRYEKMLETFTSPDLELIGTDSICLKIGLETYRNNEDLKEYMRLAGTNYESYEDGRRVLRTEKKEECMKFIGYLLENNYVSEDSYPMLLPYKKYFETAPLTMEELNSIAGATTYNALFEVR